MPLRRVQLVGDQVDEFLYRLDRFDGSHLQLEPGVAACLRTFHSFIVNMVRGAWIEQLTRIRSNQDLLGEQGDLSAFLFGQERQPLEEFRRILRTHQESRCFYCGRPVKGAGALDHFIPWARYPVDLGHNFVFTDARCNNAKRDHLAAREHLARWKLQNLDHATELDGLFEAYLLRSDSRRSRTIAIWAYEQAELSQSRVWQKEDRFCSLDTAWRIELGHDRQVLQ
jgi:5-methylcytosine-specific restriction endonuclease McrA